MLEGAGITLQEGRILGLSGPSGSGKTTLGRTLAGLIEGNVTLDGQPLPKHGFQPVQYLHQTPITAMNPRWTVARILAETGASAHGIDPAWLCRTPDQLSGGELQRVSILRALVPHTRYLIADEVTASLDPIAQLQIWRMLQAIVRTRNIGILAISHDAALLDRIADRQMTLSAPSSPPKAASATRG